MFWWWKLIRLKNPKHSELQQWTAASFFSLYIYSCCAAKAKLRDTVLMQMCKQNVSFFFRSVTTWWSINSMIFILMKVNLFLLNVHLRLFCKFLLKLTFCKFLTSKKHRCIIVHKFLTNLHINGKACQYIIFARKPSFNFHSKLNRLCFFWFDDLNTLNVYK